MQFNRGPAIAAAATAALIALLAPNGNPAEASPAPTRAPTTSTAAPIPRLAPSDVQGPNSDSPTPVTGLFWNDPKGAESRDNPLNHAQQVMYDRFRDAANGGVIRIAMYSIKDLELASELFNAYSNHNVDVRVLVSEDRCWDAKASLPWLENPRSGSWMECVTGARGMHQKFITISSAGGVPHVTLVGSSNMHLSSWQDQWNDLYQFADNKTVYDWYVSRFATITANLDATGSVDYRNENTDGGRIRVDFLPIADKTPVATQDPMWKRLDELPAVSEGRATQIRVAMWAMDETRGLWMSNKLEALSRAGAGIKVIGGPAVRGTYLTQMRDAGIDFVWGYEANPEPCRGDNAPSGCNFSHLKMTTAKYWDPVLDEWNYRVWTGSSNWNVAGLSDNFEVIQQIGRSATWEQYQQMFNTIWTRYSEEWAGS